MKQAERIRDAIRATVSPEDTRNMMRILRDLVLRGVPGARETVDRILRRIDQETQR